MKRMMGAAALVALALATAACGGTSEPDGSRGPAGETAEQGGTGEELVVGLTYIPDIQFAPWYVAEAKGYFEDEGVNVRLQHHGSSESLFGALEAGDEDVIVAGSDEMLQARAAGSEITTFGVVYQEYPVVVIVPEDSEIQTIEDLAGHTVGMPGPYGENWFAMLALMDREGLTEEEVTLEYIGYTQQASLAAGDVDAVVGFLNNDLVTFGFADIPVRALETGDLPLVGIGHGATDDVIDARAADLAAFNRAVSRALEDVIANPEEAVELSFETADELAVAGDRDAALAILEATIPLYGDGSLTVDPELWPPMYDFLVGAGIAEDGLDPSQAVTADLGE